MMRVTCKYVVFVTHFNVNTVEGDDWIETILLPAAERAGEKEEEEVYWRFVFNVVEGGAMVGVGRKERKRTRRGGVQIEVRVH